MFVRLCFLVWKRKPSHYEACIKLRKEIDILSLHLSLSSSVWYCFRFVLTIGFCIFFITYISFPYCNIFGSAVVVTREDETQNFTFFRFEKDENSYGYGSVEYSSDISFSEKIKDRLIGGLDVRTSVMHG